MHHTGCHFFFIVKTSTDDSSAPNSPEAKTAPRSEKSPEICVKSISSPEELNTISLVLSAADITHRVNYISNRKMEIYVPASLAETAQREIAAYTSENLNWPPKSSSPDIDLVFRAMSPLVVGALMLFYNVTGGWESRSVWFTQGAGNSELILKGGEFYRLITALTLHADLVHLLSNCFIGALLLHFFFQLTGNGIGLFMMVLTSALANYLNVIVHGPGHHFVGFSTAVFSVIGMLCTIGFASRTMRYFWHFFMPIMAGLALLAMLGSSGERTDLGAHLFGLLCGLVMGNFARLPFYSKIRKSILLQSALALTAFCIIFISWNYALNT